MLKVEFDTNNHDFDKYKPDRCAEVLQKIALALYQSQTEGIIYDDDGNMIGDWELTDD